MWAIIRYGWASSQLGNVFVLNREWTIANALRIAGSTGRLQAGLSPGYGFMAILVAWLGGGRPLAIGIVSVLYAGLLNGGFSLQVSGIPPAIGTILQAMLLLGVLVIVGLGRYRIRLVRPEGVPG